MLSWYFFHTSYSGNEAVSLEHKERYTREISKPGFLRSGFEFFATGTVGKDSEFFRERFGGKGEGKLQTKVLFLGGEASLGGGELARSWWGPIATKKIEYDVIPKAGHWIGAFSILFFLPLTASSYPSFFFFFFFAPLSILIFIAIPGPLYDLPDELPRERYSLFKDNLTKKQAMRIQNGRQLGS